MQELPSVNLENLCTITVFYTALLLIREFTLQQMKCNNDCHSCHTTFSLPACTSGVIGSCLSSVDRGRENWPGLLDHLGQYAGTTQKWATETQESLFLGHTWKTVAKKNSPNGHNCEQCISLFTLLGRRNGYEYGYIIMYSLWPITFSPSHHCYLLQWAHELSGQGNRDGYTWAQQHGLPLNKAILAMATAKCPIC